MDSVLPVVHPLLLLLELVVVVVAGVVTLVEIAVLVFVLVLVMTSSLTLWSMEYRSLFGFGLVLAILRSLLLLGRVAADS